jgi:hypothetical protein
MPNRVDYGAQKHGKSNRRRSSAWRKAHMGATAVNSLRKSSDRPRDLVEVAGSVTSWRHGTVAPGMPLTAWRDGVEAPGWWAIPAPVVGAASSFDRQHRAIRVHAHALFAAKPPDPVSADHGVVYRKRLQRTAGHRYVAPPPFDRFTSTPTEGQWRRTRAAAAPTRVAPQRVSIWEPRRSWCDAKDLHDTHDVLARRFAYDWEQAQTTLSLAAAIVKADNDDVYARGPPTLVVVPAASDRGSRPARSQGDAEHLKRKKSMRVSAFSGFETSESDETAAVLRAHGDAIFRIFSYYSLLQPPIDLFGMSLNEWTQCAACSRHGKSAPSRPHVLSSSPPQPRGGRFCEDVKLADQKSVHCNRGMLDNLWISINAIGARSESAKRACKHKAFFSRIELCARQKLGSLAARARRTCTAHAPRPRACSPARPCSSPSVRCVAPCYRAARARSCTRPSASTSTLARYTTSRRRWRC